jgi:two-component system, OmpR family, copper resistance phosphate regulon response regulator CusR
MALLLVEDTRRLSASIARGLGEEGFEVTAVFRGADALDRLAVRQIEAIILDLGLPDIDGLEVLVQARQGGHRVPILVLTARDAIADRVRALDAGADDYLIKPFAFEVLLARLRALARRTPAAQSPVLDVADLTLDPATHTVMRSGTELKLSGTEFKLLHFLMRRSGHTVSRQTLIEAVWGYGSSIESNTLDAFIHLVRAKVDAPPNRKLIHTVRGIGYCARETPPQ